MAAMWIYLLAIVLVPVALGIVSLILDSYRFGDILQGFESDSETGAIGVIEEKERAA